MTGVDGIILEPNAGVVGTISIAWREIRLNDFGFESRFTTEIGSSFVIAFEMPTP